MRANCVTTTMDLLADQGGRFVAAGSRRSPLMHVWHEAADGTVTRYEPDAPLLHWTHAQVQVRPITAWQLVASAWVLALTVSAWAVLRWVRNALP